MDGRVGHQGFHRFFSVLKKFCGCGRLTHIPNITLVIGVGVRVKLNSPHASLAFSFNELALCVLKKCLRDQIGKCIK